jgi:hypothetical protein
MNTHPARLRLLVAAVAAVALVAGCGQGGSQAASGGSTSTPTSTSNSSNGSMITGTFAFGRANSKRPQPEAGVKIGLYTREIRDGGPITGGQTPKPIATTTTGPQGHFRFADVAAGRRYFVFAINAKAYTVGHWARAGSNVHLLACTDCMVPLASLGGLTRRQRIPKSPGGDVIRVYPRRVDDFDDLTDEDDISVVLPEGTLYPNSTAISSI